jgi:hypothetical protein
MSGSIRFNQRFVADDIDDDGGSSAGFHGVFNGVAMKNTDGDSADGERSGDVGRGFVIGSNGLKAIGDSVNNAAAVADSTVADDADADVWCSATSAEGTTGASCVVVVSLVNSVELAAKCCIGMAISRGVSGITTLNAFRFVARVPLAAVVVVVVDVSSGCVIGVEEFEIKDASDITLFDFLAVVIVDDVVVLVLVVDVEVLLAPDCFFLLSISAVRRFIV